MLEVVQFQNCDLGKLLIFVYSFKISFKDSKENNIEKKLKRTERCFFFSFFILTLAYKFCTLSQTPVSFLINNIHEKREMQFFGNTVQKKVICTGNHMILSAIWNKYKARVNFFKG